MLASFQTAPGRTAVARCGFSLIELPLAVAILVLTGFAFHAASATTSPNNRFSTDWRFLRADPPDAHTVGFDDSNWELATLPHTARVEALIAGKENPQWQGICWYRKTFDLPASTKDKVIILRFDGAMNVAQIWVNGQSAGEFMGGYLPYVMDITALVKPGEKNVVAVRLDNRDNPITGPKPLVDLDFNLYGGLYREAHLILKDKLHITDPILADKVASGGVFVTFPDVSQETATVRVQTHVKNAGAAVRNFTLRTTLLDAQGQTVVTHESAVATLAAGADREAIQELRVANPKLWSPHSPHLYRVRSELIADGKVVDTELTRIGIRHIEITKDGFRINGEKMFLRGANRHQEYPYIGNALSDAAQYRDALKIKEAGFDYVRLSHYPQATAFLDACDELGLVVMNCIMGWQYFGKDPKFTELKYQECRQLIRRDRNHPCVILWEVSLNETDMPKPFIAKTQAIAREEFPGDQLSHTLSPLQTSPLTSHPSGEGGGGGRGSQMYTCGWTRGYDVFIQARQHGGCKGVTDMPCLVSEYGDWEYFAQNAGLEQHQWKDLQPAERNSRQLRGHGEVRLLQQALNFQEAHNDNLKTTAFADGIWVMFDYNRGYAPDIEASGVMDIFRLPKFGTWFFRSQREPWELVAGQPIGPVVFIANYWTPESPREVRVFSNCEEVELRLNGKIIKRRKSDANRVSTHVKHPPFTFKLDRFEAGTLTAAGYISGREVATHERRTPGEPVELSLRFDLSGRPFAANGKDAVFCYAELWDANGTLVPTGEYPVFFGTVGDARLVGENPIAIEAGIATMLLESDTPNPASSVHALCLISDEKQTRILAASGSPNGSPTEKVVIRYTTDGTTPDSRSPVYSRPLADTTRIRAGLFVNGELLILGDTQATAASTRAKSPQTAQATSP